MPHRQLPPPPPPSPPATAPGKIPADEPFRVGAGHASLRHSPEVILVVDDDVNVRESLAEVLRIENFAVRLACDGREAVRQFLEGPPDLILLDLNMPEMDGWEAFEIMAEHYPFVPVIVITARPGQRRRAAEAGIDILMEKPLHIPDLLDAMRRLLARHDTAHLAKFMHIWRTHDRSGTQE